MHPPGVHGTVRSIPAGAGKPWARAPTTARTWVYPRGCGETPGARTARQPTRGLSPRVRGNRGLTGVGLRGLGSIPAGAGKPGSTRGPRRSARVYPRGCGETSSTRFNRHPMVGLSPRVRGNRGRRGGLSLGSGSIPAGAGKPGSRRAVRLSVRVYPRGCGETSVTVIVSLPALGLSPRVRGNLHVPALALGSRGSIPAGAGKPARESPARRSGRVYPRGCGETSRMISDSASSRGLSPRVRGNLWPFWPIRWEESRLWQEPRTPRQ